jgi:prevent-host-death family protein
MRTAGIFEAKQSLSEFVDQAQDEMIVLTRHGKPAAVMIGVEGLAFDAFLSGLEDLALGSDPKFWAMIKERRASKSKRIPLREVRMRLAQRKEKERPKAKAATAARGPRSRRKAR